MINAYKEKFIGDINEGDIKIAVSGIVIEKNDKGIIVDDGSGYIPIEIDSDIGIGKFVRVLGFIVRDGRNVEIRGNVLQDLSDVDRETYDAVKRLMNK